VDIANNGQAALEALARQHYRLMLLDSRLSDLDGHEVARRVRTGDFGVLEPTLPIIAFISDQEEEDRVRTNAAGINDTLGKPIVAAKLIEKVEHWLQVNCVY